MSSSPQEIELTEDCTHADARLLDAVWQRPDELTRRRGGTL